MFDQKYLSPFNTEYGVWNDEQVPNTYSHYGDMVMETLLGKLNDKMNKETLLKFRWDSLQHIRIIIAIEKKFNVKIGTSIVAKLYDIASIVKFLKK